MESTFDAVVDRAVVRLDVPGWTRRGCGPWSASDGQSGSSSLQVAFTLTRAGDAPASTGHTRATTANIRTQLINVAARMWKVVRPLTAASE